MSNQEHAVKLQAFIERVKADQITGLEVKGRMDDAKNLVVWFETGRKYDKITVGGVVRFYVSQTDGTIYGAKSAFAPNTKWYFGTLDRAHLWDWSDVHPRPINDDMVRPVKQYGPYTMYMPL